MYIYVIHYTPLKDRKLFMINQLQKFNYGAQFVEIYDKENLSEKDLEIFDNNSDLKLSSKSLIKKHIESWKHILNNNINFNLILEDDAILDDNFDNKIVEYISQFPSNYDIVFIGNGQDFHIPYTELIPNINIYKKSNYPTSWGGYGATRCTDSYFISQNCCKKILNYIKNKKNYIKQPIDWWLNIICRELDLNIYWAEPTIVSQGSENGLFIQSY